MQMNFYTERPCFSQFLQFDMSYDTILHHLPNNLQ